jgi:hypothetical protein
MASELGLPQTLSLEGQVVEILERHGQLLARVRLEPSTVLDVATAASTDLHLGDRVVITGSLAVERVRQEPNGTPHPRRT